MKTTLGQILKDVQVLDEAAGFAPLNRPQHFNVQSASQRLNEALPEIYKEATGKTSAEKNVTQLKDQMKALVNNITALLPELGDVAREKIVKLLPKEPSAISSLPSAGNGTAES